MYGGFFCFCFLYTEIYSSKFIHIGATMFNKTVAFA